jgi:alpha-beta hydrolase superfamily lysophospholipase
LAGRLGEREADLALRLVPGRVFPALAPRLAAMGVEARLATAALARVRRVEDWSEAWMWAAQRALGNGREAATGGDAVGEAAGKRQAALAFHIAGWPPPDQRTQRALRASSATLFAEALPVLDPAVRRLAVPWRTGRLPALLALPTRADDAPLVVLLNGMTTAKEETIAWTAPFLARGLAVLALDWPGTGEAASGTPATADCLDLLDGVLDLADAEPALDPARMAVVGVSVGGALAVRLGQADGRVAVVVAVTPPYDAPPWLPRLGPLLRRHIADHAGGPDRFDELAAGLSLARPAGRHRPPTLIFGAGRDLIVPPGESLRLAAALGDDATLVWRRGAGHGLFAAIPAWTTEAAAWLAVVLDSESTQVDGTGRQVGESASRQGDG